MDYIAPNIAMFVWERIYADTQEFEGKNLTNERETFFFEGHTLYVSVKKANLRA